MQKIIRSIIICLLFGMIISIIAYAIAKLISAQFNLLFVNTYTVEGFILLAIGLMSMMKGNPSGLDISAIGEESSQYQTFLNLDTTMQERKATDYFKNFTNNNIIKSALSSLSLTFSGILIIIYNFIICR